MPPQNTRTKIVEAARRMFNKHGTHAVSTNRIARHLGISPGNLYYYFRNKEQIIREIFERMNRDMIGFWSLDGDPSLEDMLERSNQALFIMWKYRFFTRELISLLHADPELAEEYRSVRGKRWKESEAFIKGMAASGVLKEPEDPATLDSLLKIIWFIQENWTSYLDIRGEAISRKNVRESGRLVLLVLRPYLSQEASAALSSIVGDG